MLNLSVETWLRFLIWLAVGFIIYFAYSRQRSRLGQPGYIDISLPHVVSHVREGDDDDGNRSEDADAGCCGPRGTRTPDPLGVNEVL